MKLEEELKVRANAQCELCAGINDLSVFEVEPNRNRGGDDYLLTCCTCSMQLNNPEKLDVHHWRCLNDAIWSEVEAVKVVAYRMLQALKAEGWPQDLLDMMYLEDDSLKWARAGMLAEGEEEVIHKDSNGVRLSAGDNVVLIKDLDVKGGNFTAKRGTAVRSISLVHDNAEQIEGRVSGQHIVILTQFVKKM